MSNYVYMVQCADGSLYTGWTPRLAQRIHAHNAGQGAKYTRSKRPVRLVHAEYFHDKGEALRREAAIKRLSREEKERMLRSFGRKREADGWEELRMGKIFYLMGKSASGKNMIYERLLQEQSLRLKPMVIYTTRPIRKGEQEGVEYHFTDEAELDRLKAAGKVIELRSYQTARGPWSYFTVDDGEIDLTRDSYLGIGTLESYRRIRRYFGAESVVPLYIQVEDEQRLARALKRERKQCDPNYEELCRRFLADQKDFSEEKLRKAGIGKRFDNTGDREICIGELIAAVRGLIGLENG